MVSIHNSWLETHGDTGMSIKLLRKQALNKSQKGFTIIELMIATAVLSTVLVIVTLIIISISNLYYKGINQSRVQSAARTVTDEITRQIQLNDRPAIGPVNGPNGTQTYCVGTVRYTFITGVQLNGKAPGTATTFPHVLWRDTDPTPGTCPLYIDAAHPVTDVDLTDPNLGTADKDGVELMAPNSRLTEFSITGVMPGNVSPYTINVDIAYGADDLLCNPSVIVGGKDSCSTPSAMLHRTDYTGNVLCKGDTGQQFCSTAKLNTAATQRL